MNSGIKGEKTNRGKGLFLCLVYFQQNKGPKVKIVTYNYVFFFYSIKADKLLKQNPACAASWAERGGIKTREGAKSGV
jgi:hypothetical protein